MCKCPITDWIWTIIAYTIKNESFIKVSIFCQCFLKYRSMCTVLVFRPCFRSRAASRRPSFTGRRLLAVGRRPMRCMIGVFLDRSQTVTTASRCVVSGGRVTGSAIGRRRGRGRCHGDHVEGFRTARWKINLTKRDMKSSSHKRKCHGQSWRASPPWVVVLFYFAIDAPKTRRVVTLATGVVARLPEFQPATDGRSNTRGARPGKERPRCALSARNCPRGGSRTLTLGERVTI